MIYVGTDIVPISRIEKLIIDKGSHFLNHVFTDLEQRICNDKSPPSIHYSGKYAAKEAIKKAILSSKIVDSISFKSIEINNDDIGAPAIKIYIDNVDKHKLKVSISHAGEYAIATAILEI